MHETLRPAGRKIQGSRTSHHDSRIRNLILKSILGNICIQNRSSMELAIDNIESSDIVKAPPPSKKVTFRQNHRS